jgi:hypothetical protein
VAVGWRQGGWAEGAAAAEEGWGKHWLDERSLLCTAAPREAAKSDEWASLEALLRQVAYEADILAASGQAGVDILSYEAAAARNER